MELSSQLIYASISVIKFSTCYSFLASNVATSVNLHNPILLPSQDILGCIPLNTVLLPGNKADIKWFHLHHNSLTLPDVRVPPSLKLHSAPLIVINIINKLFTANLHLFLFSY